MSLDSVSTKTNGVFPALYPEGTIVMQIFSCVFLIII